MTPERRALHYEQSRQYKAARRRQAGVPVRKLKNPTPNYGAGRAERGHRVISGSGVKYPAVVAIKWLDMYVNESFDERGSKYSRIGSTKLGDVDKRYINRLRAGSIKMLSLTKADELSHRYDLPLWELDQLLEDDHA